MKVAIIFFTVFAAAQAGYLAPTTYLSHAPAFDSAVIKSDRLGGNFAYSVATSHAYAAHTPIVQHVAAAPVAYTAPVSYAAPALAYAAAPAIYNSPLGYGLPYAYAAPAAHVAKVL